MLSFDEYVVLGGTIQDQKEFEDLEPRVVDMIDAYIKTQIPFWRVRPIEEYRLNLKKAIILQIDYVSVHGGMDVFYGNSDLNLSEAKTSGFSYKIENKNVLSFHDLPWSTLAKTELDYQLLISGLGSVAIW